MTGSGSAQTPENQVVPAVTGDMPTVADACCKVGRMERAYSLPALDEELRRRYEDGDSTLHELAAYINDRITTVTLDAIGQTEYEPATVRAALQDDQSIPATRRDDIRAALTGQIDVDTLTSSYLSHETVRRHLNEHLDVSTSQGGFDTLDDLQSVLTSYQEQYENGVESALKRAADEGIIQGETFQVFSTRVECQECSETYRLTELLESQGCDCQLE